MNRDQIHFFTWRDATIADFDANMASDCGRANRKRLNSLLGLLQGFASREDMVSPYQWTVFRKPKRKEEEAAGLFGTKTREVEYFDHLVCLSFSRKLTDPEYEFWRKALSLLYEVNMKLR